MSSSHTIDTENYYHITGANGSNHNRNKAIQHVKNHYQIIIENILDYFQKQEIVYLVFSAGGGTGSGISPLLLDMLSINQEKVFGAVCVLPDINEPVSVQLNAYNCMIQLSKIKNIGSVFVLDNSKNTKEMVNVEFFKAFNSVINIPRHIDARGNIDISEIKELLSIRGVSAVSISEHSDSANIIKTLEKSCFSYEQQNEIFRYDGLIAIENKFTKEIKFYFIEVDLSNNKLDKVEKYNSFYQDRLYEKEWWLEYVNRFPAIVVLTHRERVVKNKIKENNTSNLEFIVYEMELIDNLRGLVK